MSRYEELKKELPAMAELVQLFPEATQGKVLDVLVDTLLDRSAGTRLDVTTGGGAGARGERWTRETAGRQGVPMHHSQRSGPR